MGCRSEKNKPVALVISDYPSLVTLFKEWRAFENPPLKDGAPDYTTATFEQRMPAFKKLQERLLAMDTTDWPIEHKVDWRFPLPVVLSGTLIMILMSALTSTIRMPIPFIG